MHRIGSAFVILMLLAAAAAAGDGTQAFEAAQALQRYAAEVGANGGRTDFVKEAAASDLPSLADWRGAVRSANDTILYFGADPRRISELSPEEIARTIADHEDQLASAIVSVHRTFPRLITDARDFVSALPAKERNSPARQDGLGNTRNDLGEMVTGSVAFPASSDAKAGSFRALTRALREQAARAAKRAPQDERGRLARLVATLREKAPAAPSSDELRAILTMPGKK
ncbi:MAG TPA: hypothetical protein VK438_17835 [Xanthobacteraceae bacterium]|nr:hypothetical protein [Xanthobacteraceae bacterium]